MFFFYTAVLHSVYVENNPIKIRSWQRGGFLQARPNPGRYWQAKPRAKFRSGVGADLGPVDFDRYFGDVTPPFSGVLAEFPLICTIGDWSLFTSGLKDYWF